MSSTTPSPWRERLASPLTWHYVAFTVLLVAVIGLSIRFGLDWAATSTSSTDALAGKQVQLKALDLETAPLRGLDKRVDDSRAQMQAFYSKRIPPNYSSIANRVGELALKGPVRLTRMNYTQGPPGADFTEISLDAGITGDYPQIMRFVNGLRVSTWLRPADAEASGLPLTPQPGDVPVALVPSSTAQRKVGE